METLRIAGDDDDLERLRQLQPALREVYLRLLAVEADRVREEPVRLAELRSAVRELRRRLARLDAAIERTAPPA